MSLKHAGTDVAKLMHAGAEVGMLIYRGAIIYPDPRMEEWLTARTRFRWFSETDAVWFEVGWVSVGTLDGNAEDGWEDPDGYCRIKPIHSTDLVTWNHGMFVDSPVEPVEDIGGGNFVYWARAIVPKVWKSVMCDFTIGSARQGKTIEEISIFNSVISLPHYPYAMPADAATLQADLRAEGYDDATVTVTAAALSVDIRNYTSGGRFLADVTMSGTNVTGVAFSGSTVSLPSYPYSMPSQRATLQTDLRTAGFSGAVVMLYDDEWEITLPDVVCGEARPFALSILPADPHPVWVFYGNPQTDFPQTLIQGTYDNVRTPAGAPLEEDIARKFARFQLDLGARYDPPT